MLGANLDPVVAVAATGCQNDPPIAHRFAAAESEKHIADTDSSITDYGTSTVKGQPGTASLLGFRS